MISLKATDRPIDPRIRYGKVLSVKVLSHCSKDGVGDENRLSVTVEMEADLLFFLTGRPDELSTLGSELGRMDLGQEVMEKVWSATARR